MKVRLKFCNKLAIKQTEIPVSSLLHEKMNCGAVSFRTKKIRFTLSQFQLIPKRFN